MPSHLENIKRLADEGLVAEAGRSCLEDLVEENREAFAELLSVVGVVFRGGGAFPALVARVKELVDDYDDAVRDAAIRAYGSLVAPDPQTLVADVEFVREKLSDLENTTRARFVDIVVANFNRVPEPKDRQVLLGLLVDRLLDDRVWKVRMAVLDFLTNLQKREPSALAPLKERLVKLVGERDVDVAISARDFLLEHVADAYQPGELEAFVGPLDELGWKELDGVLWLLERLVGRRPDLVESAFPQVLSLLDHDDVTVARRALKCAKHVVASGRETLEDQLFGVLGPEGATVENAEALEELFASVVRARGGGAFERLVRIAGRPNSRVLDALVGTAKLLEKDDPAALERAYSDTVALLVASGDLNLVVSFLRRFPRSNLVLVTCACSRETGGASESIREALVELMPDLEARFKRIEEEREVLRQTAEHFREFPKKIVDEMDRHVASVDVEVARVLVQEHVAAYIDVVNGFDEALKDRNHVLFQSVIDAWSQEKPRILEQLNALEETLVHGLKARKAREMQEFNERMARQEGEIARIASEVEAISQERSSAGPPGLDRLKVLASLLARLQQVRSLIWQVETEFSTLFEEYPHLVELASEKIVAWSERKRAFTELLAEIQAEFDGIGPVGEDWEAAKEAIVDEARLGGLHRLQDLIANSYAELKEGRDEVAEVLTRLDEHFGSERGFEEHAAIKSALDALLKLVRDRRSEIYELRGNLDFNVVALAGAFQGAMERWEALARATEKTVERVKKRLDHWAVANWIVLSLRDGPVKVEEVAEKFQLKEDDVYEITRDLVQSEKVKAIVVAGVIKVPEEPSEPPEDVAIFRQFLVKPGDPPTVAVFLKVENVAKVPLSNVSVQLNYDPKIFDRARPSQPWIHFREELCPHEFFTTRWDLVRGADANRPATTILEIKLAYRKDLRGHQTSRRVDVLLM